MNWFEVLKEQRQVSRNIQSFKPIQLDKPIKIKKPEEDCKTWFENLDKLIYDFFVELLGEGEYASIVGWTLMHNIPDEIYCKIKEAIQTKTNGNKYDLSDRYSLYLDFYDVDHFNIEIALYDKKYKSHPYTQVSGYWFKDRRKSRQELIEDNNRGIEFVKKLESYIGPNALTKEMIDSAKSFESFINQRPHKWFNEDGSPRDD